VSASPDILEGLFRPSSGNTTIDRKALAGLLLEVAQSLKPDLREQQNGLLPADVRLEQLRTLLLGREIEVLSRVREVVEDPEQLAQAVGRVLPTAIAQATADTRLGHVLAPAMEKATESSIRSDPGKLVNIFYPLIVPAIRKSIGETIDETFQSLNETLKYSLTWRGLRWRWEAWRTGVSFAEVVLKHTLVYQVEHAFLIHRHTGLLICHVAAENAASQDPQLVSSMLVAIQDFVRDSFSGAGQQGLDSLRLGELRLWSEPGPFATLVAVIRGDPPEGLHDTLRDVLTRIHAERYHALESFDGDSSTLADIEAQLTECVALRQKAPPRAGIGLRRLIVFAWLVVLLMFAGAWGARWWQDEQLRENYVARLRAQPGIVIVDSGRRDGKFVVTGLRDPLAVDPREVLRQVGIDPERVVFSWAPYQALDPQIELKRLQESLDPPPSVNLAVDGDRIVARGEAPSAWLERARIAAARLPAGAPSLDLAGVRDVDEGEQRLWDAYIARLRAQPGIVITDVGRRDGKLYVGGLRDPLAIDPQEALREAKIDPARVASHWAPYEALDPEYVLKRSQTALEPPPGVTLSIDGDHVVARGLAPSRWLERARAAVRMLPAHRLDLSGVQSVNDGAIGKLREAIQSHEIHFDNNASLPAAGQDAILDQLAAEIKRIASLSSSLHVNTRVTLTGHSDTSGQGTFNLSMSLARAEAVRALLRKRGVDPDLLAVRGAGPLEPLNPENSETARAANRRVSFSVAIDEEP
jgi:outer membrane protein OmpA-like peptidoglycan-associated protein